MINKKDYVRLTENDRKHFSNAPEAAKWLLGKALCRKSGNGDVVRCIITETEAYTSDEKCCYGYGKSEKHPLCIKQGHCCVFAGMLLIACGDEDKTDNVLIRAVGADNDYHRGPCKLCEKLGLDKSFTGIDLITSEKLWLETDAKERQFCEEKRVGISANADDDLKNEPRRFIIL